MVIVLALAVVMPLPEPAECSTSEDSVAEERRVTVLSEKWLSAVANNDSGTALSIARELVTKTVGSIPESQIELLEKEGIKRCFLTAPFDHWDFQLWRDAYFFKRLSAEITHGDTDNVRALFDAVRERIAPHEGLRSETVLPWPYGIWQRGFGVCDRQAWLLSELAYQAGWETQVVYLIDPMTVRTGRPVSPHTVGEIRAPGGVVYFADPYGGVLLAQKSVDSVAADGQLSGTLWPEHPDWTRSLQDYTYWTPSYPQDYRLQNQGLYRILKAALKDRCPRFGAPPDERLSAYLKLRQEGAALDGSGLPPFPMRLWKRPMELLREDIRRYADQGHSFFLKGEFEEAIAHYSEALHLITDSAVVHFELGDALAKQGRLEEAIDHYNEALVINPSFTDARRHLKSTMDRAHRSNHL